MTKLIRCIEGHVYDSDQHTSCPVCGAVPGVADSGTANDVAPAPSTVETGLKLARGVQEKAKTLSLSNLPLVRVVPVQWLVVGGTLVLGAVAAIYVLSGGETPEPVTQTGEQETEQVTNLDETSKEKTKDNAAPSGKEQPSRKESSDSPSQQQSSGTEATEPAESNGKREETAPNRLRWAGPDAPPSAYSKDIIALHQRAGKHLSNGDYDSAIADYTEIIRRGSATWTDYSGRGLAYHHKKQRDLAVADYSRAIERRGHNEFVHYNRSVAYKELGQADKALADLDAAIDKHGSTEPNHYLARADTYLERHDFAKAIKDYSTMIDLLAKDNSAGKDAKAFAYFVRGRAKEIQVLNDQKRCNNPLTQRAGEVCEGPEAYKVPLRDYEAAIAIKPDYAQAYLKIGWIAGELGDNQKALESYTKAIKADPTFSMAYSNRCVVYTVMKEMELALADCNDAIRHDPNNHHAWANRGVIFATKRGRKNRQRAIADLRHALQLQPDYPFALEALRRMGVKP